MNKFGLFRKPLPGRLATTRGFRLKLVLLATLSLASAQALAQAAPCNLHLSEGVLDYGAVARMELAERQNSHGTAPLAKRTVTLTAICKNATPMGIEFTANSGEQGNPANVTYRLAGAQLDGIAVQLVRSETPEKTVSVLKPGDRIRPQTLSPGKQLTIQLEVQPELYALPTWATRDGNWRGSAGFELYTH